MPIIIGLPIGGGGLPVAADSKIRPGSLAIAFAADVPTIPKTVTFTAPSALAVAVDAPTITSPGNIFPSLSGMLFRYRAGAEAGSDGTAVGTFTDQSGNGRNATQGTGANQPTLKTNILNGKSVYRFDGTNDSVSIASWSPGTATVTIYAVVNNRNAGTFKVLATHSANRDAFNDVFSLEKTTADKIDGVLHGSGGTYGEFLTTATIPTDGTFRVIRFLFDKSLASNECTVELNHTVAGTRPSNGDTTGNFSAQDTYIGSQGGSAAFWNGDIAEFVCVNRDLTTQEKSDVDAYFLAEYGV